MSNKYIGTKAGLIGPVMMEKPHRKDYYINRLKGEFKDIQYSIDCNMWREHLSSLTTIPCEGWKPEAGREYTEGVDFNIYYKDGYGNWYKYTGTGIGKLEDWVEYKAVKIVDAGSLSKLILDMSGKKNAPTAVPITPAAPQEGAQHHVSDISQLLELLAQYGGEIVSTASLDVQNINQARASGRMYVDANGLGFVWMPPGLLPETEKEVERFEKWFPLKIEMPENLKTLDWMKEKNLYPASLFKWAVFSGYKWFMYRDKTGYWSIPDSGKQYTTAELYQEWKRIKEQ